MSSLAPEAPSSPSYSKLDDLIDPPRVVDAAQRAAVMLEQPFVAVAVAHAGRFRETNASWQALFALPPDVSVETEAAALFPAAALAERFERAAGAAATRQAIVEEQTLTRRDGSSFTAEIVVWLFDGAAADRVLTADAIWQVRDVTDERGLTRALRELEEYHRELDVTRQELTFVIDRKGRLSFVSPSVTSTLGYTTDQLLGEPLTHIVDPSDVTGVGQWLRGVPRGSRGGAPEPHALRVLDDAGRSRTLLCRPRNCFDVAAVAGMIIHAVDVTATVAAPDEETIGAGKRARVQALRGALVELAATPQESLSALLDATRTRVEASVVSFAPADGGGAPVVSPAGSPAVPRLATASDNATVIALDDATADTVGPDVRDAFADASVVAAIEVPVFANGELAGHLGVGVAYARLWEDPEIDFVVGVAPLAAAALAAPTPGVESPGEAPDALTGLPDRAAARRWLEDRATRLGSQGTLTMFSIDLDRLQNINDRHGHAVGDAVIARAGRVMTEVIGAGGLVARVGGDAFVVVLTNASGRAVDETAAALLPRLAATEGDLPRIEASVGIARLPGDAADVTALWLYADLAMREAKNRGRGQTFLFDPRLANAVRVRKALDVEIVEALERDEFLLFYQPQISLATGKVMGLEALLRWQHPTRGLVLPDMFIAAAVECGLIEAITKTVVNKVCQQIAEWRGDGEFPELPVGVNVASEQFHDRRLPALVASALLRSGLPARLLVLELSEQTLVVDAVETERVVKELSNLGVRTAVGGFALGHGALKQLRQLRVAQIKLDRDWVDTLPTDEPTSIVVRTMLDVARQLKCQVIAEGVETREQFDALRALSCEAGQGFFFGAPLSAEEIRNFVAQHIAHPFL